MPDCQTIVLSPHLLVGSASATGAGSLWRACVEDGAPRPVGAEHEKPPAGGPARRPLFRPHLRVAGTQSRGAAGADAAAVAPALLTRRRGRAADAPAAAHHQ